MRTPIEQFIATESGAVTVDWVVLSAAIIGMGMVLLIPVGFSVDSSSQRVANTIGNQTVGYGN